MRKKKKNQIITEENNYDVDYNNYGMNDMDDTYDFEPVEMKEPRSKFLMNLFFIIIIALGIIIVIDVVCVVKYDKGPYFAIRTKTYDDGGTQEFYGLGYKVIKYHQEQGRRDTEIGFWTMPYSTTPTNISTLDLAIEFRNDPQKTAEKYAGQFMRVTGRIYKLKDNEIILRYEDPDDAYTLKVKCPMAEKTDFSDFEKGMEITVLGTIDNFTLATKTTSNSVNMSNCFAE